MPHSHPVQSQEHGPMVASHGERLELLACVIVEVIFTADLHELVALGFSRTTESRKVRSMEIAVDSGEKSKINRA